MSATAEMISEEIELQATEPDVEEILGTTEGQAEAIAEALPAEDPDAADEQVAVVAPAESEAVETEAVEGCSVSDELETDLRATPAPVVRPFRQYTVSQLEERLGHHQRALSSARMALGLAVLRNEETDTAYDALAECERTIFELQCAIEALPDYMQQERDRVELERLANSPCRVELKAQRRAAHEAAKTAFLHAINKGRPSADEKAELAAKMLHAAKAVGGILTSDAMNHIRANRIDMNHVHRFMGRMK